MKNKSILIQVSLTFADYMNLLNFFTAENHFTGGKKQLLQNGSK